ncbi:cobalt ECF transporter T component CbiQ [Inediibacterium massiliense]|uniref:cobalt ECF transporter T component CbiQ n=1 Tax=Inediibacterium massiliense TaxID=1658111 RepID=UPI0006B515BC|nr:cobalt ECF transporter T component CbiQ [Inediibacterium massiliense]
MISIDKLAYTSTLRRVNPLEKFIFVLSTMMICLICNHMIVSIAVLFTMSFMTVVRGKINFKLYLKFMSIPLAFLIIGIISIALNMGYSKDFLFSFGVLGLQFGCTKESIGLAVNILLKSFACVSGLYFLSFTTPMIELLSVLKKLKFPSLLIELMSLIYRFIFVLLETVNMIYIAQDSRLGYVDFKSSYYSLGKLITSLFVTSYKKAQDLYISLEARGYDGEIHVIENTYSISYKNLGMMIVFELFLVLIYIYV